MLFKNRGVQTYWYLALMVWLVLGGCADEAQTGPIEDTTAKKAVAVIAIEESVSRNGEWVMEGYSPQRTRATFDQAAPPLTMKQEFIVGGQTQFGSPVGIAGGLVFVEGHRKLHALTLDQGEELWFFDLPGSFISPAIAGNHVFVRAESGERGYIFALTADAGLKLWQFKFPRVGSAEGNLGGHATSPVIVEGLVLVGASQSFHALNAQTGETVWTFPTDEPITSSASVADGTVFFVDFDNLYAIDLKAGTERWRFTQRGLAVVFAPVISGDQVITTNQDEVYALNRHTGEVMWHSIIADERLIPAGAAGNRVYIKSTTHLYALDQTTGAEIWSFQAVDFVSLPAITPDLVYVITRAGGSGQLRALDLLDGKEIWRVDNERLANAAPVVVGHQVYVRTKDGSVLIYS